MIEEQLSLPIADLPPLSEDERDDAAFRGRDRAWSAVAELFDHYRRTENLTYSALGQRINKSRSQVQRWISSPFGMNMASLGLLAEGLNADLDIRLTPRVSVCWGSNHHHPREAAKSLRLSVLHLDPASRISQPANNANITYFNSSSLDTGSASRTKMVLSDG